MSDFEMCPVGTVARLAQVEAERDALRIAGRLDLWGDQGDLLEAAAELRRLAAIEAEREALLVALKLIAATDPVDAALDPGRAARIAYAAIPKAEGVGNG